MSPRATPPLATLERWMQTVVMHPDSAGSGVRSAAARRLLPRAAKNPGSVVLPSKALSSIERLNIYAHMYYARLLEVLENEYPTTRRILGDELFWRSCRAYVHRHPSRNRTLNSLSEQFPAFLVQHLPRGHRSGLAADVAHIERAMEDVFDAPRAEPLTAAEFAAIGADEWGRVRLRVNPALKFLKLRYPANTYMNAVRGNRKPRVPRPRKTFVIVFRRDFTVFRREQQPEQLRLLQALAAGRTLAQAVRGSVARRRGSADELAATLGAWFRQWAADRVFCK
jgi:hypothetical protein